MSLRDLVVAPAALSGHIRSAPAIGERRERPSAVPSARTPATPSPQPSGGDPTSPSGGTPVFLTSQTIVTFPGASLAVLILWKMAGLVIPSWNSNIVPIVLALIVGVIIYYVSLSDNMTRKERVLGGFLALLNSCYVALFVIGVPLTFRSAGG